MENKTCQKSAASSSSCVALTSSGCVDQIEKKKTLHLYGRRITPRISYDGGMGSLAQLRILESTSTS